MGKNVDKLKWVLRPSGEIIQPPLLRPSETLEMTGFLRGYLSTLDLLFRA